MKPEQTDSISILKDKSFIRLYLSSFIILCVVAFLLFFTHSRINTALTRVKKARSQVTNVLHRQRDVSARYRGRPVTRVIDAEISGARNRVRIEIQRYDRAVSEYNRKAGTIYGRVIIFFSGLPKNFSLSDEITDWSGTP